MKVPAFTVSRLLPQRLDGPPRRLLGDAGNSRINEATGAVVTNQKSLSSVSQAAKYVRNFTSFSFVVGLVLITVIFFKSSGKGGHRLA